MTWTPRNTINVIFLVLCLVGGGLLAALSDAGVIHGAWIAPTQAALGGLLAGLMIPGSPIGRLLDQVFPVQNTPKLTADQAQQLVDDVKAKAPPLPVRIPPGASTLLVVLLAASTLHGCGAHLTDSQHAALAIETQRCLINERAIVERFGTTREQDQADLAMERVRCDAARDAITNGATP
jgi:hypothetical protein